MSFQKYAFNREPFLSDISVQMHGREEEWEKIIEYLNESLTGNRIRSFFLIGDYGFGKSFTISKIISEVMKEDSTITNANKTLIAYVVLAETVTAPNISWEYVTKIMVNIGKKNIFDIASNFKQPKKISFSERFSVIIEGLKNEKDEAYKWLTGETLDSSERSSLGISSKLQYGESLSVLMDFLKFIKLCGYENLLVLIDEFEYAVNVYSEQKLTELFHTFKNIYDYFVKNGDAEIYAKHIQIIAITPKGYDHINELEKKLRGKTGGGIVPWMERMRFERNQVSLKPLDDENSKLLLEDRIKKERTKNRKVSYETFPFIKPSFFEAIIGVSHGKPRNLLDFSEIVLEEAIRRDYKEIDGKIALYILSEYKLIEVETKPQE